jgi:hypothetical protein
MSSIDPTNPDSNRATLPGCGRRMGIAETAETRLRKNSFLALRNIACNYAGGVLTLTGYLPSYYLKQVAQEIVAGVPGVQRVVNRVEVMPVARGEGIAGMARGS